MMVMAMMAVMAMVPFAAMIVVPIVVTIIVIVVTIVVATSAVDHFQVLLIEIEGGGLLGRRCGLIAKYAE
jgi:hypothetical protein